MGFFIAKRKLFKFLFPLGISLFLISPQNLKITQSPLQFLSPPSQVPIPAETFKTLKEIQILFDRLSHILEKAEDFKLEGDFELRPLRVLSEKLGLVLQNKIDEQSNPKMIVNHAYLIYLYLIVDIFNTSFFSSEAFQNEKEEAEEIMDALGRRFLELSYYYFPGIEKYRSLWIRYHQKMIGGILHETRNKLNATSSYFSLYMLQGRAEFLSDFKEEFREIDNLLRYLRKAKDSGYSKSSQFDEIQEEDWQSIEEAHLFYIRTYLIRLSTLSQKLKPKVLAVRESESYLTLDKDIQRFVDLTLNTVQVVETFIHFYLKGKEFPLEHLSFQQVAKNTVSIYEVEKSVDISTVVRLEFPQNRKLQFKGNPILIQQVIINLIKNAMEHAHPSQIVIRGSSDGDHVVLEIENDSKKGEYIPAEMLEQVPFYGRRGKKLARLFAADFTNSRDLERGFGVKLAWQFINAHGGSLTVRSNQKATHSEGKTIFTIKIPKAKAKEIKREESARFNVIVTGKETGQSVSGSDLDQTLRDLFSGIEKSEQAVPSIEFEWKSHPAAGLFVDASL